VKHRKRATTCIWLAALAITLAGCGISVQSTALPLKVPANQFTSPTNPPTAPHPGKAIDVYFLTNGHLVASLRHLPQGKVSLNRMLQLALNGLGAGPLSAEFELGVTTALSVSPAAAVTLIGTVKHHVATVDHHWTNDNLDTSQLFEADAQIVYTLTQFHQVHGVNLVLGGVRIAWLPDGLEVNNRPVTRQDYRAIAPPTRP
jgi:spore germination protein GerM